MSDLQTQLERAKAKLSAAAGACLRNEPGAAEAANVANAEVAGLLAMQRAQRGEQCRAPGCRTLTLRGLCDAHRPQGEWAISEQVRDELNQQHNEGQTPLE
jgi:hypothetical protein